MEGARGGTGVLRRWVLLPVTTGALGAGVAVAAVPGHASGQTVGCDTWIAADGNFSTPTNWSSGAVPTSADDACITDAGVTSTYTVILDSDASVHSLTIGAASGTQI